MRNIASITLAMTRQLQKLQHFGLVFKDLQLHPWIMGLGVEQKNIPGLHVATIQPVSVALGLLALERVLLNRMQQRGLP